VLTLSCSRPDFAQVFARIRGDTQAKLERVLTQVGVETVTYLRSLTEEMRPPVGARQRTRADGTESSTLGRRQRRGRLRKDGTRGRRTGARETGRQAHPGHWADVTGQLALAYAWTVTRVGSGVVLVLSNSAEYAAALEARDGYFVLSGVADPGGPVDLALRAAIARVAPDWRVEAA
jgi:hypothetical protein